MGKIKKGLSKQGKSMERQKTEKKNKYHSNEKDTEYFSLY